MVGFSVSEINKFMINLGHKFVWRLNESWGLDFNSLQELSFACGFMSTLKIKF